MANANAICSEIQCALDAIELQKERAYALGTAIQTRIRSAQRPGEIEDATMPVLLQMLFETLEVGSNFQVLRRELDLRPFQPPTLQLKGALCQQAASSA